MDAGATVTVATGDRLSTTWPQETALVLDRHNVLVAIGRDLTDEDHAILDRLALTVRLRLDAERPFGPRLTSSTAVALLVDPDVRPMVRDAALRHLALGPSTRVRVVVAAGPKEALRAFTEGLEAQGARTTCWEKPRTLLLLCQGLDDIDRIDVPRGVQAGISGVHPTADAPRACREAEAAFRFSQPSTHDSGPYRAEEGAVVRTEMVHGYEVLAEALTPDHLARISDLHALDAVLQSGGLPMLETLDVVVSAGSIRQAARTLRAHHNSVAHRVAQAERGLGFSLSDSYGRTRLFMALTLRRLRETHQLLPPHSPFGYRNAPFDQ